MSKRILILLAALYGLSLYALSPGAVRRLRTEAGQAIIAGEFDVADEKIKALGKDGKQARFAEQLGRDLAQARLKAVSAPVVTAPVEPVVVTKAPVVTAPVVDRTAEVARLNERVTQLTQQNEQLQKQLQNAQQQLKERQIGYDQVKLELTHIDHEAEQKIKELAVRVIDGANNINLIIGQIEATMSAGQTAQAGQAVRLAGQAFDQLNEVKQELQAVALKE